MFLVQLPPPVHGVSILNKIITGNQFIQRELLTKVIELKFSMHFKDLRKLRPDKLRSFVITYYHLRNALINFRPDLVYFSFMPIGLGLFRDAVYLKIIKNYCKNIIIHLDNRGIKRNSKMFIYRFFYSWIFKDLTILHVSEYLINDELSLLSLKNTQKKYLPNTCNSITILDKVYNNKTINILFISNIFREKGVFLAIDAISELATKYVNIKLNIYGQPMNKRIINDLMQFITSLKLTDKIIYHGYLSEENKCSVFSSSDIFIFTSYFREECMPLVVLEAMQAGLPIVASKIGAVSEILENEKNGLIYEPGRKDILLHYLENLIQDENLRYKLGEQAKKDFENLYKKEIFDEKIYKLIQTQLANP